MQSAAGSSAAPQHSSTVPPSPRPPSAAAHPRRPHHALIVLSVPPSPTLSHQHQGAYLLSFASAVDAVRFCHSAQALLMYSQWPPDCADFCGRTGALLWLCSARALVRQCLPACDQSGPSPLRGPPAERRPSPPCTPHVCRAGARRQADLQGTPSGHGHSSVLRVGRHQRAAAAGALCSAACCARCACRAPPGTCRFPGRAGAKTSPERPPTLCPSAPSLQAAADDGTTDYLGIAVERVQQLR